MILAITLLTSCLKLLLLHAYRSTDFEVHRNWLAITHSAPIEKWYYLDHSEWTLDYPPLFAWFEYLLSWSATLFDPNMLKIENINYASDQTIMFQRLSVIFTDLLYVYGVQRVCKALPNAWNQQVVLPILLITNCGLVMVDHIHFQYNGFLYGVLLLSIAFMLKESFVSAAFTFAVLLNLKHIYLYIAPAYFIYLLKHYCIENHNVFSPKTMTNVAKLGGVVLAVFGFSFLPFINHLPQVLSRLFPFKRGLSHAYWAPNFWALYNTIDKVASITAPFKSNLNNTTASMTGGLVQEFSHTILPTVTPLTTVTLTCVFTLPAMIKLFYSEKSPFNFLRCMILCGLCSFLFGWHVHEKAILMVIIPWTILAIIDADDARTFLILSTVGHYSLFPLLFPSNLIFVKILLHLLYTSYAFYILHKIHVKHQCNNYTHLPLLNALESIYIMGLIALFIYENFIHKLIGFDTKLPFLPLMLTSLYCSLGVIYCWIRCNWKFYLSK